MNNLRNKVQLIGRLGQNPEFKKTTNGKSLAKISIATKEVYKTANNEKVVETQWHSCIAWGSTAERIEVFLKKGNEMKLPSLANSFTTVTRIKTEKPDTRHK